MSAAADRARAKAASIAATRPVEPEVTPSQDPAPVTPSPTSSQLPVSIKPIRISLDLAPALFDQLTEWRTKAARQLGRGRVTNADALRVLVRTLLADEELTARVIGALRRESDS
jgi:hypothetical protein